LVWLTSLISIGVTFAASKWQLGALPNGLWWKLSVIISCGTLAAAVIPEFVKIFTSSKSKHCEEVVTAAREGGASLDILSGLVAGNFSAFWLGMAVFGLMFLAYITSTMGLSEFMIYPSVFAFGLVAFGMLGMGPVTIAVDSYGPVTDNAQSVYELSLIDNRSFNVLPDPPRRIRAEAKPALIVELLDGLDKPKIALFDDIGKGEPSMHISLTDTDHQTEIRFDHLLARLLVPRHDPLAQLLLLLKRQQGRVTDLAQVALEGIQSFGAATRLFLADERLVHTRRRDAALVVMVDDVSARFAQIV
jgi:hypothetical protein